MMNDNFDGQDFDDPDMGMNCSLAAVYLNTALRAFDGLPTISADNAAEKV